MVQILAGALFVTSKVHQRDYKLSLRLMSMTRSAIWASLKGLIAVLMLVALSVAAFAQSPLGWRDRLILHSENVAVGFFESSIYISSDGSYAVAWLSNTQYPEIQCQFGFGCSIYYSLFSPDGSPRRNGPLPISNVPLMWAPAQNAIQLKVLALTDENFE